MHFNSKKMCLCIVLGIPAKVKCSVFNTIRINSLLNKVMGQESEFSERSS